MSGVKELRSAFEAAQQTLRENAKATFLGAVKTLFKDHPGMKSAAWTQYTPYFNDGDVCEFSVNPDKPEINGKVPYDDEFTPEEDKFGEAISKLLGEAGDDLLEAAFEDHAKVTVYQDGRVEVEEYEHD